MEPTTVQFENEEEGSGETNSFLPTNTSTDHNKKSSLNTPNIAHDNKENDLSIPQIQDPCKDQQAKPIVTQAVSISMVDIDANCPTDDETAHLNTNHSHDHSQNISVTDETKEDDDSDSDYYQDINQGLPAFTGQIMRQLSDGTVTINAVFKIMGRIYIHQDDMFQRSCYHEISNDGAENKSSAKIVRYSELPEWHSVNIWIANGYRDRYTVRDCVKSIIKKHNECGNIWTEFVPGFGLIAVFIHHLLYDPSWILYLVPDTEGENDRDCNLFFIYGIFYWINFMIILIRPFISGCAHWFHPISRECYNRWWKADYISIVWSTMASASNFAVCEFFCSLITFGAIQFCLVFSSLILTVFIAGASINANMGSKQIALFIMLSFEFWGSFIYSVSVLIHSWRTNNEVWMNDDHFRYYLFWFLSVIFSWIAAAFRVTQLPERCIFKSALKKIIENAGESWKEYKRIMRRAHCEPQKVNDNKQQKEKLVQYAKYSKEAMEKDSFFYYYFTSHQFWHLFVNLSVLFQILAWIQYFTYRKSLNNPCC